MRLGDGPEAVVEACIDTAQHIGGYMLVEDIHLVSVHGFPCLQKLFTMLETACAPDADLQYHGMCNQSFILTTLLSLICTSRDKDCLVFVTVVRCTVIFYVLIVYKGAPGTATMKVFLLTQPSHSLPLSLLLSCDIVALPQRQHEGTLAGEIGSGLTLTEHRLDRLCCYVFGLSRTFPLQLLLLCNRSTHFISMVQLLLQTVQETSNLMIGQSLARHGGRIDFSRLQQSINFCLEHVPSPLPIPSASFLDCYRRSCKHDVIDPSSLDTTSFNHPGDILRGSDSGGFRTVSYVLVKASGNTCRIVVALR